MKKSAILLILPVLLFGFVAADWVTVQVDERVAVDFPSQPVQKDIDGRTIWQSDIGQNQRCMVFILDFEPLGLDSAQLEVEMTRPEAQEEFRNGSLGQMPGATVISESKTITAGKNTFEFVYDLGKKDSTAFNKLYSKHIFVGAKMYLLSFYEVNGKPEEVIRNRFFSSFKLK